MARGQQRTIAEAGAEYVDHLEHVMERKRTTIQDYRGYMSGHFAPFFGERPLDRIDERVVAAYLNQILHSTATGAGPALSRTVLCGAEHRRRPTFRA